MASICFMEKYLLKRGWSTFRSSSFWINTDLMDDMTVDFGGVDLKQAYEFQKKQNKLNT